MALLQTTLDTVKVGLIEVVAVIRRCNYRALFEALVVKAAGLRLVLFCGHSASVPKGGKVAVGWECGGGRKVVQEPAEKLCPT